MLVLHIFVSTIFVSVEDLIDGRFISGAGGGGFLQVILKKDIKRPASSKTARGILGKWRDCCGRRNLSRA